MHLTTIIPCLDYADLLRISLPSAVAASDRVVVVTSPRDRATRRLCDEYGVTCLATDRWRRGGAVLNKAGALDDAIEAADSTDWLLLLDADIVLPADARSRLESLHLDRMTLYGAYRRMCRTPSEWRAYAEHGNAELLPLGPLLWVRKPQRRPAGSPMLNPAALQGYFQLWNAGGRPRRLSDYPTAAQYDVELALRWPDHLRRMLPPERFTVIHLGENRANWQGRVTETWREEIRNAF